MARRARCALCSRARAHTVRRVRRHWRMPRLVSRCRARCAVAHRALRGPCMLTSQTCQLAAAGCARRHSARAAPGGVGIRDPRRAAARAAPAAAVVVPAPSRAALRRTEEQRAHACGAPFLCAIYPLEPHVMALFACAIRLAAKGRAQRSASGGLRSGTIWVVWLSELSSPNCQIVVPRSMAESGQTHPLGWIDCPRSVKMLETSSGGVFCFFLFLHPRRWADKGSKDSPQSTQSAP